MDGCLVNIGMLKGWNVFYVQRNNSNVKSNKCQCGLNGVCMSNKCDVSKGKRETILPAL